MPDKMVPNCYKCVHRREIPGNVHSRCNNYEAKVRGDPHGIKKGWFRWPFSYDPVWLESCKSFSDNPADNKPDTPGDPLAIVLSILR